MNSKFNYKTLQYLTLSTLFYCVILSSFPASSNDLPIIFDARVVGDEKSTRFVADVSQSIPYKVSLLDNPYRVVIDIPQVIFEVQEQGTTKGRGLVSDFRYGLFSPGMSRLVLDALNPIQVNETLLIPPSEDQPARLVVNLISTTNEEFSGGIVESTFEAEFATSTEENLVSEGDIIINNNATNLPVVVIDPGHGGIDNGTKGEDGVLEKNVVLEFAKILHAKILEGREFLPYLTRVDDRYLTLSDRVNIAREREANLFISLHADSVPQTNVRGATVYTFSRATSDDSSAQLAIKENQSDLIAGVDLGKNPVVSEILFDLVERETMNFSHEYSQFLVKNLISTDIKTSKNPNRSGGFQVLTAPEIPSVLLELGYLSNKEDKNLLTSKEWQIRTAEAIVGSLSTYFQSKLAEN